MEMIGPSVLLLMVYRITMPDVVSLEECFLLKMFNRAMRMMTSIEECLGPSPWHAPALFLSVCFSYE